MKLKAAEGPGGGATGLFFLIGSARGPGSLRLAGPRGRWPRARPPPAAGGAGIAGAGGASGGSEAASALRASEGSGPARVRSDSGLGLEERCPRIPSVWPPRLDWTPNG